MKNPISTAKGAACFLSLSFCLLTLLPANAETVTWDANPADGNWENTANWTPEMLPESLAAFGASSITDITLPHGYDLTDMVFKPGASSYSFQLEYDYEDYFFFTGNGVQNNSGVSQSFFNNSLLEFDNHATAGSDTVYTNVGGAAANFIVFKNTADAGSASITNEGSGASAGEANEVSFQEKSSAASSSITNSGSGDGAGTVFFQQSTAGQSRIVCRGLAFVIFQDESTAADSSVTAATPGTAIDFNDTSTAGAATLTALPGGHVTFNDSTDGGTARVRLVGGTLIVATRQPNIPVTIRSLEGRVSHSGTIPMVETSSLLQIGSNDRDTTYGGEFVSTAPTGALAKVGSGKLTLEQDSPDFDGTVTVAGGTLIAANATGSATGTGNVFVNADTLGGNGIIGGGVTIGTGNGSGAFLAPSVAAKRPLTLACQSTITFKADSTYTCQLNSRNGQADQLITKGVTIESGAQFDLETVGNRQLTSGTVFIVISNTSTDPISGTFANLADGAVISVGKNKFQASYEGGDGNDLTLTVQ